MNVIEVRGLTKRYGDVQAVAGVDITVRAGEFFGLLGPNGAGKTTTLELIEGLREADSGEITVFGEKPWPRNTKLLPRIGVQLQASAFFERLTVREQLNAFADLYGVSHKRTDEMIEIVGLQDHVNKQAEKLSGGQQQRLAIAGALIHEPEIVFLDEPTAALDPQARRNLWEVLRGINSQGRTVILTTHYMDEAEALCDRVAIIDAGKILAVDPPATLVRNLDAPAEVILPENGLSIEEAQRIHGVERVTAENGSLIMTTPHPSATLTDLANRNVLQGLQVRGATLEDVFLTLTGREYRA